MFRCLPFLLLTGCVRIFVADDAVTFADPVTSVVAELDAGSVEIVGADVAETTVERHAEHTEGAAPELFAELVDGVLTLRAECPQKPFGACFVDHRVLVPSGVAVTVETGSGGVAVANVAGPLEATTGSGAVEVADVPGSVTLDTGSGAIRLAGATGPIVAFTGTGAIEADDLAASEIDVETGSGSVDLRVTTQLLALAAVSGSGSVELRVPSGAYALDLDTGAGDIEILGVTDDVAGAPLRAETGSGDVRVVGE